MSGGIIKSFIGLALVMAGVLLITYSLYTSWHIFTGKTLPPQIFKASSFEQPKTTGGSGLNIQSAEGIQNAIQSVLAEQLGSILPITTLPSVLNLTVWSMFAGLLVLGGSQIASIGIRLLKA